MLREMLKIPVGYRFFPKDDELISEYVLKKVLNQPLSLPSAVIMDNAFVYGSNGMEPWNLCSHKTALLDDEKHYFFTELKRVSKNRLARTVGVYGSWHVSSTSMIYDPGTHNVIGIKKLMNFKVNEEGKMKRTDWIMHEFSLAGVSLVGIDQKRGSNIVLCVIRNNQKKNKGLASDPLDTTTNVGDLYTRHDSVIQIGSPSSRGLKRCFEEDESQCRAPKFAQYHMGFHPVTPIGASSSTYFQVQDGIQQSKRMRGFDQHMCLCLPHPPVYLDHGSSVGPVVCTCSILEKNF